MIACGIVCSATSATIDAKIPGAAIGDGVRLETVHGGVYGAVTAVRDGVAEIAVHGAASGICAGDRAVADKHALYGPLGVALLGRAIDALGRPLDGGAAIAHRRPILCRAPSPDERIAVSEPFWTGIRAIDGLLTIGRGARIGIFGPAGAGKSTLLCAIESGSDADAVVVALIGERGREAQHWIEQRTCRTTIVCATSDRAAAERAGAARLALAHAAHLRLRGLHVLLILDSLARLGTALRELAIGRGESLGRGGFPPSVFGELAAYLEVSGACAQGSITMAATVLADGDERDPLSEAARSLLDGHIELSSTLAGKGSYPAIDVLESASRTMPAVTGIDHRRCAQRVRARLAQLRETADARAVGIVSPDPAEPALEAFLRQSATQSAQATLSQLEALARSLT